MNGLDIERWCRSRERGQAIPVLAMTLWLVAGMALVLATIGSQAVARARAQAGADAVALAEAAAPGSATTVAGANGVSLESLRRGALVEVTVGSQGSRARAVATRERADWRGLDLQLQHALARAEAMLGVQLVVVSGLRSRVDQERLWAQRDLNRYPVAAPGTSLHERGLAVDVPLHQANLLAQIQGATGLCQPLPLIDPVHFILCLTTPTR